MAILSDADKKSIWVEYMEDISSESEEITIGKSDLRAAIDAIDQWVDDNQASFNAAIPLPARTELIAKAKAALLVYVVNKRWEVV